MASLERRYCSFTLTTCPTRRRYSSAQAHLPIYGRPEDSIFLEANVLMTLALRISQSAVLSAEQNNKKPAQTVFLNLHRLPEHLWTNLAALFPCVG